MVSDFRKKDANYNYLISKFDLEEFLDKKLGHLSGGTRQKVNVVLAFMFDSSLIILDEPTTGLDPVSLIQLKELILEERGKTILITSHIMNFVEEMSDDIIFLMEGSIHYRGNLIDLFHMTNEKDLEHAIAALLTQSTNVYNPQICRF